MKEFSKENIEINGQEYTLFLNRQGIVAWEKYCKNENEKIQQMQDKYVGVFNEIEEGVLADDTNPFEGIENFDSDLDTIIKSYKKLFWIMLYTEHKLKITQSDELFDLAVQEYGKEQLIALIQQMIEEANKDLVSKDNLKNLAALKPKK